MSGHTPGPWEIVPGDEWTTDVATVDQDREREDGRKWHWNVASVNRRRDEWEANRRLIAAAPNLLEAARLFVEYDESDPDNAADLMMSYARALAAARAAIVRATQADSV